MNKEDIIRMAREAWFGDGPENVHVPKELERFAALVAAAEREALEKTDWAALLRQGGLVTWGDAYELGDRVIDIIRARGQQ